MLDIYCVNTYLKKIDHWYTVAYSMGRLSGPVVLFLSSSSVFLVVFLCNKFEYCNL